MQPNGHRIIGGSTIIVALVGYVWWMAAQVVPATMELAAVLGMSVSAPAVWLGLTVAVLILVFGAGIAAR